MATKIAGEYIAELQVQFDKKSQSKQGKELFNQHVSNLHKQNQHTIKESEKTAEKSTEASFKGTEKGVKKGRSRLGGIIRLLSKASLVFNKTLSKIPLIGGLLTPLALGGRFLTYDPKNTLDDVGKYTNDSLQALNYSNLLGVNPQELVKKVDELQRMGLSKESAMGLIGSTARRTGSNDIDDISSYINQAYSSFKNQDNLINKEAVAKAYGLNSNDLVQLQTNEQLKAGGYIPDVKQLSTQTNRELNVEGGVAIGRSQLDINKDIMQDNSVISKINNDLVGLIKNINDVNMIDIDRFNENIKTLDTQVLGYKVTKKLGIGLDEVVNNTVNFGKEAKVTTDSLKDLTGVANKLAKSLGIITPNNSKTTDNKAHGSILGIPFDIDIGK